MKDHLASFSENKMVGGGRPLLPEILSQPAPVGAKSPPIFARSASAVTHGEKSQLTLIGNPLRAFQ